MSNDITTIIVQETPVTVVATPFIPVGGGGGGNGATGATGPQGIQGAVGQTGATGVQGPTGLTGNTGAVGQTGATGVQGPAGAVGQTGATGVQGPAGSVGQTGATGVQGAVGVTGATGIQGPAGSVGQTGATGVAGTTSFTGLTDVPVGLVSSSIQVSYTGLSNMPVGILSSSTQFNALSNTSASYAQNAFTAVSASWAPSTEGAPTTWASVTGKPDGLVSSSLQATTWSVATSSFATTASFALTPQGATGATGAVGQTGATGVQGLVGVTGATGIQGPSGSIGQTGATGATGPAGTTSYAGLTDVPVGIVSSSTQVQFSGISGRPTGLVSASVQVNYTGLSGVPVGILSSSTQFNALSNTSASYAATASVARSAISASWAPSVGGDTTWENVSGKPVGLVSSSVQAVSWSVATASVALNVNNTVGFTKPTFVIDGGDVVPRDLVATASYGLVITSGTGVLNNRVITWPTMEVTTSAGNSIIFATPAGIISSSITNGPFYAEADNKLILHRSFVDVSTFGARIYAVEGSKTFNRNAPRGELNTYRLPDYVVASGDYSGAVAYDTTKSRVQYYYANIALLNFVKEYPEIVRGHLDNQILRHYQTGTGTGEDDWETLHDTPWAAYYHWPFDVVDPTGTPVKVRADSHDSYAATFVLLAVKYAREVPGGLAWWDANYASIFNAIYYNILIRERFIGVGYLTSTFQDILVYPVLQTFDNMEVYAAVRAAFDLMLERGGTQATDVTTHAGTETNILNGLRDAWTDGSTGHARWGYSGSAWLSNDLTRLYPDLNVHSGYALYDIPEALASSLSDRGIRQGRANDLLLNTAENWYDSRQYDLFPNGYVPASLVATGHSDIGNTYIEFVSTHVAYDAPLRYGINEVGWVKRIQDELNTNTTTLNANFVSGSFSGPIRSTSFISGSSLIGQTVHATSVTGSLQGTASFAVSASWAPSTVSSPLLIVPSGSVGLPTNIAFSPGGIGVWNDSVGTTNAEFIPSAHTMTFFPFLAPNMGTGSIQRLTMYVETGGVSQSGSFAFYTCDAHVLRPRVLLYSGSLRFPSQGVIEHIFTTPLSLSPNTMYWIAFHGNATPTVRVTGDVWCMSIGCPSPEATNYTCYTTGSNWGSGSAYNPQWTANAPATGLSAARNGKPRTLLFVR